MTVRCVAAFRWLDPPVRRCPLRARWGGDPGRTTVNSRTSWY